VKRLVRWLFRLILLIVILAMAKWAIDIQYQQAVMQSQQVASCHNVWAHRGRLEGDPANTLSSAQRLVEAGVAGLELDIHYDIEQQVFWVIHDDPLQADKQQRDNLETFLRLLGPAGTGLWLDAKNFGSLSPWEAISAADRLQHLLQAYPAESAVYVESRNPFYLLLLQQRGIGTSYLISPNSRHASAIFWLNVYWMKWSYSWGPFDALSMDIGRFDQKVEQVFGEVPLLLSTLNKASQVKEIVQRPNVAAILSDRNLYHISRCN